MDSEQFETLGIIHTSATHAALLVSLNAMRPQWNIRLVELDRQTIERHYRVDVKRPDEPTVGSIDVWLRVKSALMTAFPADKPNAVTAVDP